MKAIAADETTGWTDANIHWLQRCFLPANSGERKTTIQIPRRSSGTYGGMSGSRAAGGKHGDA